MMKAQVFKHEDGSVVVDLSMGYTEAGEGLEEVKHTKVITDQSHRAWRSRVREVLLEGIENYDSVDEYERQMGFETADSLVSVYNYQLALWLIEAPMKYQWCLDEAMVEGMEPENFWGMLRRAQYYYIRSLIEEILSEIKEEAE